MTTITLQEVLNLTNECPNLDSVQAAGPWIGWFRDALAKRFSPDKYDIDSNEKINALFKDHDMVNLKYMLWEELKKHDSSLDKAEKADMSLLYGSNHQEAVAILRDSIIPSVLHEIKRLNQIVIFRYRP